jgi:hypothetical protein
MNTCSAFVVGLLRPEDVAMAYPLVRTAFPATDRHVWLRSARRALRSGRNGRQGILVARVGRAGRPCGLISFHCDPDMRMGRVLTAEHFVALTFGDVWSVLEAFLPVLENTALRAGCSGARVILPHGERVLLARLAARAARTVGGPRAHPMADLFQEMA